MWNSPQSSCEPQQEWSLRWKYNTTSQLHRWGSSRPQADYLKKNSVSSVFDGKAKGETAFEGRGCGQHTES